MCRSGSMRKQTTKWFKKGEDMTYRMYDGEYTLSAVPSGDGFAVDVDRFSGKIERYLFATIDAALLFILNVNLVD